MGSAQQSKVHVCLLILVILVFIWSIIKPENYLTWVAEVGPTVIILIVIVTIYHKFRFTTLSYVIMAFLFILTFIGGHFTYAEVPLFNWLKEEFDLSRNHYDRFGHFSKGLSFIVMREILIRKTPLSRGPWLSGISINIVLAIAALYEILEWLSTKFPHAKKFSNDFLGMQGDKWDAQWDMSCALAGAILTFFLLTTLHDRQLPKVERTEN